MALLCKVDESKTSSLMDEFVKDIAASNMGMLYHVHMHHMMPAIFQMRRRVDLKARSAIS